MHPIQATPEDLRRRAMAEAIDSMSERGGHFAAAIARAWEEASGDDRARLEAAFADLFSNYVPAAAREHAQLPPSSEIPDLSERAESGKVYRVAGLKLSDEAIAQAGRAMRARGGAFNRALSDALDRADGSNFNRLLHAFGHIIAAWAPSHTHGARQG